MNGFFFRHEGWRRGTTHKADMVWADAKMVWEVQQHVSSVELFLVEEQQHEETKQRVLGTWSVPHLVGALWSLLAADEQIVDRLNKLSVRSSKEASMG